MIHSLGGLTTEYIPVLTSFSREKLFRRTLNCLLYRLLKALIGGRTHEAVTLSQSVSP